MKAIIFREYGGPEVLRLEEIDKPTPGTGEVLVRVRAAALNAGDRYAMRGIPYLFRPGSGVRRPKNYRIGADFAGEVEEVGAGVTEFRPGQAVFGVRTGAFGEYICKISKGLAPKPSNLTFEEAAAVPIAAGTALQGLRDKGRIQAGQEVLINGASGGVGTFAVQISKAFGATVTAVCSTDKVDLVRSILADRIIDYTREDYTRSGRRYDLVFDNAGSRPLSSRRRVLNPGGIYVVVGAPPRGKWIGPARRFLMAMALAWLGNPNLVTFVASIGRDELTALKALVESGKVGPVVERSYALQDVPEAMRHLEQGHARGKLVINVSDGAGR